MRFHDQVVAVRAREVEAGERDQVMDAAHAVYVGYAAYERRISGRAVHVMVLDAASERREAGIRRAASGAERPGAKARAGASERA